jgi:hypothetical protein
MTASLESVLQTLSAMERFFRRDGKRWARGTLHNPINGSKCLMGALTSVQASSGNTSWVPADAIGAAEYYLERAVRERGERGLDGTGVMRIVEFNDSRRSFAEIAAVIARAKQLATADLQPSPVPQTVGPWSRPALTYQPEEPVKIITMADLERVAVKRR